MKNIFSKTPALSVNHQIRYNCICRLGANLSAESMQPRLSMKLTAVVKPAARSSEAKK